MDLLIEYGADLNKVPQDRNSFLTGRQGPLVAACRNGDLNMTQFLLERGADPNIDNKDYGCPLACAVDDAGNLKLVELLLHSGANIEVKLEIFSRAIFGGERVISRLLEEPMTKEDRERYLDQALQSAAYWAILEMCSWLLDEGANPNYHGGRWGSPLTAAITANHNIHQSAGINNRRLIIDLLLRHGADVNQSTVYTSPKRDPNVNGDTFTTPLLLSLENGPTSTAQKILEAGADPNIPGGEMHLPLQTAARCRWAMVEPLLAAGAEVNAVGGEYGSALHAAAYTQNIDTIKLLLAHGADVTITAGKYGSVLQAAAKSEPMSTGGIPGRDSVAAMKLLVAAGADVHTRCGKYGSLLQMAAKSGNLRGMRWLVEEMGVDVNVKGGRFGSVRAAAVMKGRWAVLSYLENKYGKFKWGGETNKDDKWIGWVTE